ncbi:MAG: hypothetical protein H7336_03715 [Bacteriovorax sp.]|nr:hypothetical protein [Bacteriovorax sp.]
MLIGEKINFKKYFLFSAVLLVLEYFLARNTDELKVMLIVFLAACLNQFLLVRVVQSITKEAAGNEHPNKFKIALMSVGKMIVLILALVFSVQIMGKRVIIPVLIYILQIVVLYLSMKNSKAEPGSK